MECRSRNFLNHFKYDLLVYAALGLLRITPRLNHSLPLFAHAPYRKYRKLKIITTINSPLSAPEFVEVIDLLGTTLVVANRIIKKLNTTANNYLTENSFEHSQQDIAAYVAASHTQSGHASAGIDRVLQTLAVLREEFRSINDMKALRDVTSASYAADCILEELNQEN